MRRKRKKVSRFFLPVIVFGLIIVIAVIFLIVELNSFKEKNKKSNIVNVVDVKNETQENKEDKILKFDTFVKKQYSKEEIENFSSKEINEILDNQINYGDIELIDFRKILGSSRNFDSLKSDVSEFYDDDQFVNSVDIILENDIYYIIEVNLDYISPQITRNYVEKVLVFKEYYYNSNTEKFNMDDINIVKEILDIKYYVQNYKNNGKRLIQSFIEEIDEKTEYTMYYFDIEYQSEKNSNVITLVKEKTVIDSATGQVELIEKSNLKENVIRD